MIHYKSCAQTVGALTHVCDPCDTPEMGRVRSLILIKRGTQIAIPLVKQDWKNAIEAGNIIIIPKTIGSFDGGTPVMGDGYGDEIERKIADDYVLTVKDPAYKENVEFWKSAEKEKWHIGFVSETQLHIVNDSTVRLTAKAPIEEGTETRVVWNVELKWRSKNYPTVIDKDTIEDFLECFDLIDESGSGSASASAQEE